MNINSLLLPLIHLVVFTAISFGSYCQTSEDTVIVGDVIGKVINAETQEIIQGATVYWQRDKNKYKTTNEEGIFRIRKNSDDQVLVISYPGKKEQYISFEKIVANYWEIDVKLKDLGVTSVTASRWEKDVNETPASIVVVTREEIEANGYITLQEILENVPGLYTIDHRSESGVTIGIRGFWADYNKSVMIQVNGVNMLSERRNDFPLFKINIAVQSIDKIEIVRGPMSIIYGAGAFFGVINIITNDARTQNRNILSSGVGFPLSQRNFFRYSTNTNGLQLSFNAMTYLRKGFKENWEDFADSSNYYGPAVIDGFPTAKTIHDYHGAVNSDRYSTYNQSLNLNMVYKNFFSNVHFARSNFGFSYLHPGPNNRNDYKSFSGNFQAGYMGSLFKDRFDYQIKSTYMQSEENIQYDYFVPGDTLFNVGQNHVASFRNELNTRWIALDTMNGKKYQLDVVSGLYYNHNFVNYSLYEAPEFDIYNWYGGLDPDSYVDTYAGYAQADLLVGKLQFIGGFRLEQESDYKMLTIRSTSSESYNLSDTKQHDVVKFIPRAAFIYSFSDTSEVRIAKNVFKMMYGKAVTEPTVLQNATDIMYNNYLNTLEDSNYEKKAYLSNERIYTAEIGHTLSIKYAKSSIEINTNLFYNQLIGLITRVTSSVGGFKGISSNSDAIVTKGIESIFQFSKEFDKIDSLRSFRLNSIDSKRVPSRPKLVATASFSYQYTRYSSANFTSGIVPFSPPILATAQLRYARKMWHFSLMSNYVASMTSQFYLKTKIGNPSSTPQEVKEYSSPAKGYARISTNIRLTIPMKNNNRKWSYYANLKVDNLLNTKYYYPTYSNNPWASLGMPGRGRFVMFSFGYIF